MTRSKKSLRSGPKKLRKGSRKHSRKASRKGSRKRSRKQSRKRSKKRSKNYRKSSTRVQNLFKNYEQALRDHIAFTQQKSQNILTSYGATNNNSKSEDYGFCTARNESSCKASKDCDWNPSMGRVGVCKLKRSYKPDYGFSPYSEDSYYRDKATHELGYGPKGFGYYSKEYTSVYKIDNVSETPSETPSEVLSETPSTESSGMTDMVGRMARTARGIAATQAVRRIVDAGINRMV